MGFEFPYGVLATIHRPGVRDWAGDSTGETTHVIGPCDVKYSSETDRDNGQQITLTVTLTAPEGSDVRYGDRFTLPNGAVPNGDGIKYAVDGNPDPNIHPITGWTPGTTVIGKGGL